MKAATPKTAAAAVRLPATELLALYRGMLLIREAELRLSSLFADGDVPGFIHLSVGQEAVAVGVCQALEPHDTLASNHRGHGHAIARGLDLSRFFAELMGREEGYCRGRGGSMHIADMTLGMLGANGIVGAGLPIALGSALAHQVRGDGALAAVFFGDGALGEGVVYETFNLAALWKLPLLFVCENNGWSEFTRTEKLFKGDLQTLGVAFGIPAQRIDGDDVAQVAQVAIALVREIRDGGGPRILECLTNRVRGHFEGDAQKYRLTAAQPQHPGPEDPLLRTREQLVALGMPTADLDAATDAARDQVDVALAAGRAGREPSFEGAMRDVYTEATGASHG